MRLIQLPAGVYQDLGPRVPDLAPRLVRARSRRLAVRPNRSPHDSMTWPGSAARRRAGASLPAPRGPDEGRALRVLLLNFLELLEAP